MEKKRKRFKIVAFLLFIPFMAGFIYMSLWLFGGKNKELTENDFTTVTAEIKDIGTINLERRGAVIDKYYVLQLKGYSCDFCTVKKDWSPTMKEREHNDSTIYYGMRSLQVGDTITVKAKKEAIEKCGNGVKKILMYSAISHEHTLWNLDINGTYEEEEHANIKAIAISIFVGIILYTLLAGILFKSLGLTPNKNI